MPPQIHLHTETVGSGEPILLVHGFGGSTYTWRSIIPALATTNQVIAVDLKGFGLSPKPLDNAYEAHVQATLLSQMIIDNRWANLTIVGHSFGGAIALMLAANVVGDSASQTKKLVLIDALAYRQPIPLLIGTLRFPILPSLALLALPPELYTRWFLQLAYYDDTLITNEQVTQYASYMASPGAQHAIVATARQIVPENVESIAAHYTEIKIPTLLVHGDHDVIVPSSIALRLHRDLPQSKLCILPKCGHMPQEESPADLISVMTPFLNDI